MPQPSSFLPVLRAHIAASVVLARGLLVGGAQKRLPPGETPRPPAPLKPRKAQRDIAGPRFERGGRRVLATARVDYRPRLPVMSGNEMQDELAPLLRQRLKSGMPLRDREGSKLMPIAIQDRLIDRAARLGQGPERPNFLASRSALKARCQRGAFLPSSCRNAATANVSAACPQRPILSAMSRAFRSAQL